jgi:YVTN family beta-propeller protein
MRPPSSPRAIRRLALVAAVATVVVLSSLLAAPSSEPRGASVAPLRASGAAPASIQLESPPPAEPRPATAPDSWAGTTVATLLPNYNASLPGNFPSQVDDWQVGAPAYVPTTGIVWWPELDVSVGGSPNDTVAPALLYDLSTASFVGVDPAVTNASAFAFDPTTGRLYATEPYNDTVEEINVTSGLPTGVSYPVGSEPSAIVLDSSTGYLFVANAGSGSVSVINPVTRFVLWSTISVMPDPTVMADDSRDGMVYVASGTQSMLDRLNASSPTSTESSVNLVDGPSRGLAFSNETDALAVTSATGPNITLVKGSTGGVYNAQVDVGGSAAGVVAAANGSTFLICNFTGDSLSEVNASTFAVSSSHLSVGLHPSEVIALGPNLPVLAWIEGARNVSVIAAGLRSVTQSSYSLGPNPSLLAYDATSNRLYVGDPALPGIEVINPSSGATEAPPIPLPSAPISIAFDAGDGRLFVGLEGAVRSFYVSNDSLAVENASIPGANGPMALDSMNGLLWIGRSASGDVQAIEPDSLEASGTVAHVTVNASGPDSLIAEPGSNVLLAVNSSSGRVVAFNGTSGIPIGTGVAAGTNLSALVWDSADQLVYAAGADLSAINPVTMSVVLAPIAIAPHSHVGGIAYDASREAIYVATWSGNYSGSLSVVNGSSPSAASSSLTIVPTGFEPSDPLSFVAAGSGLPGSGTTFVADVESGTISVIASPPQILSALFEPSRIDANQSTRLQVIAVGGAGDSSFAYRGLPAGCASGSGSIVPCAPTESGTFTVLVTVTDSVGETASTTAPLVVASALSVQMVVGSLSSPQVDENVSVAMSAMAFGGTPGYNYSWSFGDGGTASGSVVTHTYHTPGEAIVAVTATDATSARTANETLVSVAAYPAVRLSLAPGSTTDVNLTLNLSAETIGGVAPIVGTWTFGDGSGSTAANTTHAWQRAGLYAVNYTSTDALGVPARGTASVLVDPELNGGFSVEPTSASPVVGTTFDFNASLNGGTPGYRVVWSFGDGSNATGEEVTHAYAHAGSYTVNVAAYDAVGGYFNETISNVQVGAGPSRAPPIFGGGFGPSFLLGLVLGGTVAAVALFVAERSRRAGPSGPPSPYVPPPTKGRG